MSWFADYCEEAAQTDRLSSNRNHVTLLATGLFGERIGRTSRDRPLRVEAFEIPDQQQKVQAASVGSSVGQQ